MANTFDVDVVGIDLSVNMISFALEQSIGLKCAVEFEVADCSTKTYLDINLMIYSRDTILHIQDKPALFRSFYKWLKPGGKVLINDYCRSAGTPSVEFSEYIKQRGYELHDVKPCGQMLKDAGYDEVIAENRTEQVCNTMIFSVFVYISTVWSTPNLIPNCFVAHQFNQVLQRELNAVEKDNEASIHPGFSEGWCYELAVEYEGKHDNNNVCRRLHCYTSLDPEVTIIKSFRHS